MKCSTKIPDWFRKLNVGLITEVSSKYELDPDLIAAFIQAESAGNPHAIRYEPNWKYHYKVDEYARKNRISKATETHLQACSFGLLQIMGTVCRELGWNDELTKMTIAKINLMFGCKKIKRLMLKYDEPKDAISAYNQGSPRKNSKGEYANQAYVDKVWGFYQELKG